MGTDSDAGSVASAATSQVSEMTTSTVAAAKTAILPSNVRSGRYQYKRGFKKPATTSEHTTPTTVKKPKFVGAVEELEGNIYDCNNSRQSDIYVKTTMKIAEYVGRSLKYGDDARIAIDNMSIAIPGLVCPVDYADKATKTQVRIWEKKVDEYVKRSTLLDQNMRTVYNIVLGQCTDIMRQKLVGLSNFSTLKQNGDGLGLLKAIKDTTFEFQGKKFIFDTLHDSSVRAALCKQGKHMTTQEYMEMFQNVVDVIEHSGGSIEYAPAGEAYIAKEKNIAVGSATPEQLLLMANESKQWYLATAFLKGADKTRYGKLIEDTRNSFFAGEQ
eukprot:scaffold59246_cov62-Attheya_sp.AAC.2